MPKEYDLERWRTIMCRQTTEFRSEEMGVSMCINKRSAHLIHVGDTCIGCPYAP